MKQIGLCVAGLLTSAAALAGDSAVPLGTWVLPGSSCPFALEISQGHVTRTTGTLTYSTKATFVPSGDGWLLDETLEKANNGLSCKGEKESAVVGHLKDKAYIEVRGDTLYYFLKKGQPVAHAFIRRAS